jgi:hypothetical protein
MLNHSYRLRAIQGLAHPDDFLHPKENCIDGGQLRQAQAPSTRPIWYTAKLTSQAKLAV